MAESDPINPLDVPSAEPEPLPAPEPLADPLPADQISEPANGNGNTPAPVSAATAAELEAVLRAVQGAGRRAAARTAAPGPMLGAIQSDLEQLHAEATATRRSVQLLALSLGAIAALVLLYAARGLRAGATVKGA